MLDNQENQAKPQFTLSESEPDHLNPKTEKTAPELVPSRPEEQGPRENSATSTSTVSPSQNPEFDSESPQNRNPVSEPEVYSGPSDVADGHGVNEKELISDPKASLETGAAEEQQRIRTEKVFVLSQPISVRIPQNISSNTVTEGDIVYLENLAPVSSEGQMVADVGARVRTRIIDARPSHQGSRGSLGVRLEALETIDGQWLDVSYHDIIDRKKEEIIFRAGTVFDRVELKSATLTLKVVQ